MSGAANGAQQGELEITRLELRTILAVDLGWAVDEEAADAFLRERGRPGWLDAIARVHRTRRRDRSAAGRTARLRP